MWQRSAKSHSHRPSPANSTIASKGGDSISYFFEEKKPCIFLGKIVSSQAIIRNTSFDQKSPRHWKAGIFRLRLGWIGLGPWADSVKKYTLMQISRYISTIFQFYIFFISCLLLQTPHPQRTGPCRSPPLCSRMMLSSSAKLELTTGSNLSGEGDDGREGKWGEVSRSRSRNAQLTVYVPPEDPYIVQVGEGS